MLARPAPWLLSLLAVAGCSKPASSPGLAPSGPSTVTLTSVAFADDCGGTPPAEPPAPVVRTAALAPAKRARSAASASAPAPAMIASEEALGATAAARRCEQTSMQLAISSAVASELHIKRVEVFDHEGASVGTLTASRPTRWSEASATYEPWDEKVAAGQTAVSYVLSQPSFIDLYHERDRTYTVKVVATVGGADQPLQTTVMVVGRPPPVPT